MHDQVFTLLNDKIEKVETKVDDIASDVKKMLLFKYQIVGGSVVLSVIASIVFQVILVIINK